MTTTIGMWEMVSELLEGEKLPVSMNEALEGLCNGDLVIAERHEFSKLEADIYALKAQTREMKEKVMQNADLNEKVCLCKEKLKPIAWMAGVEGGAMYTNYEYPNSIPLYTHPVKELTDEEIREVAEGVEYESYAQWKYEFARAILRKAQER